MNKNYQHKKQIWKYWSNDITISLVFSLLISCKSMNEKSIPIYIFFNHFMPFELLSSLFDKSSHMVLNWKICFLQLSFSEYVAVNDGKVNITFIKRRIITRAKYVLKKWKCCSHYYSLYFSSFHFLSKHQ